MTTGCTTQVKLPWFTVRHWISGHSTVRIVGGEENSNKILHILKIISMAHTIGGMEKFEVQSALEEELLSS